MTKLAIGKFINIIDWHESVWCNWTRNWQHGKLIIMIIITIGSIVTWQAAPLPNRAQTIRPFIELPQFTEWMARWEREKKRVIRVAFYDYFLALKLSLDIFFRLPKNYAKWYQMHNSQVNWVSDNGKNGVHGNISALAKLKVTNKSSRENFGIYSSKWLSVCVEPELDVCASSSPQQPNVCVFRVHNEWPLKSAQSMLGENLHICNEMKCSHIAWVGKMLLKYAFELLFQLCY